MKAEELRLKVKQIIEKKAVSSKSLQERKVNIVRTQLHKKVSLYLLDDSSSMRQVLREIFKRDSDIEIVGEQGDPLLAIEEIRQLKPDVLTLDIEMPHLDGVEFLKRYGQELSCQVITISSLSMSDGPKVMECLEHGSVDYMQKPSFKDIPIIAPQLIEKVKTLARSTKQRYQGVSVEGRISSLASAAQESLILMGASTGGTEALKEVLVRLPADIPPILIVQHIPPHFSKSFADRLNQLCAFEVREARDGDLVEPGVCLVAPGGKQMMMVRRGGKLIVEVNDAPEVNRHKPSVDYLFASADEFKGPKIAVILTGMGADGAREMVELTKKGTYTIAQDEISSVVWGMPGETVKRGGALKVVPLTEVALEIEKGLKKISLSKAS